MPNFSNKNIEKQLVSRIYGNGRGWAFSRKDFSLLGNAEHIDKVLSRLTQKGTIRRIARGLYDYPKYSKWLQQSLGPDMDQVAHALARKFGWNIQVTGNAALNILGISTQVPTRFTYLSDGNSKTYQILDQELSFKKAKLTHLNVKYPQSALLVQAIDALGEKELTEEQLARMAAYLSVQGPLSKNQQQALAKDTQYVTSWIQNAVQRVLKLAMETEPQIINSAEPQIINSAEPQIINSAEPQVTNKAKP
jgi:predicted transcriptional regulator of viral defense system